MCVLALAWNLHPRWRLLLVGNRDELHARPSAPLARWDDVPAVVAGRDLEAGGTWMGVGGLGRAAVVTNVRDPRISHAGESRGLLVSDFLRGRAGASRYAAALGAEAARYRPFNLLLFDRDAAHFVSNVSGAHARCLDAGIHGLSNGNLDAPWPKVLRATAALHEWLDSGEPDLAWLLDRFGDETIAPDAALPDTGVGIDLERQLSPLFVRGERYGTRATTLIALGRGSGGCIIERRFGMGGVQRGETRVELDS